MFVVAYRGLNRDPKRREEKMYRKRWSLFSLLITVVIVMGMLVACAPQEAAPTTAPAATEPPAAAAPTNTPPPGGGGLTPEAVAEETGELPDLGGVTLQVSAISETYAGIFHKYDDIWEQMNVSFEFTMVPAQDTYQKDMLEFAGGGSSQDIVFFQPAWMADYAPHLIDLGAAADEYGIDWQMDDAMAVFSESYTQWDGVHYAIPADGDQFNFYYNKVAFEDERNIDAYMEETGEELRVPETWDEYVQVAEFFNGRDWDFDGTDEYGVAEAWLRGGYAYYWWLPKFFGYGGVYFDEEMNPLINSPAGIQALEHQVAIADFVPEGSFNFGSGEARAAWLNGDVPMVVHWTSSAKLAKDPTASKIVENAGIALVPGVEVDGEIYRRTALPTGWVMGITTYSDDQEAAAQVMAFLAQPERSLEIALDAALWCEPWRASSFDPAVWEQKWPEDPEYGAEMAEVMQGSLEIGVPDLQIPGQDEYVKALDAEIASAIAGEKSVEDALNDAAEEWNNITDRLGRDDMIGFWNAQYDAMKANGIEYRPEIAGE